MFFPSTYCFALKFYISVFRGKPGRTGEKKGSAMRKIQKKTFPLCRNCCCWKEPRELFVSSSSPLHSPLFFVVTAYVTTIFLFRKQTGKSPNNSSDFLFSFLFLSIVCTRCEKGRVRNWVNVGVKF